MKRFISIWLALSVLVTFCVSTDIIAENTDFDPMNLSAPEWSTTMEWDIYSQLIDSIDSEEYFIENVEVFYISQEYLDEFAYNSKENIFFGYSLSELNAQFEGKKYVFTLDENYETTVQEFEDYQSGFDFGRVLKNVAIGTGVIVVCVTLSCVTAPFAPAVSAIFAFGAKGAAIKSIEYALLSGIPTGIVTWIKTGDVEKALQTAAIHGSEGFKYGAIVGAITGGYQEAVGLKGATTGGLTMNQVAQIQRESKYPLDVIKAFNSMEQYNICKEAGLRPMLVNGKTALVRTIDPNFVDELGQTNLQRMRLGYAALDPSTGKPMELHHIGQKMDSTLAILTREEHRLGDNSTIWHEFGGESQINRGVFDKQKKDFWIYIADHMFGG